MHRLLLLLSIWAITILPAVSQPISNATIQEYTTENGLPSNGIKGLQWDQQTGFLWIATEAGIVRFNGVDFRSYTKENMPAIASERMLFMTRNRSGSIYISDLAGNIFTISQSSPVLWRKTPGGTNPYYANYYLLPVADSFFNKYTGYNKNFGFSAVTDEVVSLSDTSCLINNHNSLYYQSIALKEPVLLPLMSGKIGTAFKINNIAFIASTSKEIFRYDIVTRNAIPVEAKDESGAGANSILAKARIIWDPGMNNPVVVLNEKAWVLTFDGTNIILRLICTAIPQDAFIRSIKYNEINKVLFIGTDSKGLIVIYENRMESKRRQGVNQKNRNSYYSQIELSNGNVLTNEGDIIGNSTSPASVPIKGKFTFNLSVTDDSLLWYMQFENNLGKSCLHKLNRNTGAITLYDQINNESLVARSGGNIYLLNNLGIAKQEADSFRYVFRNTLNGTSNIVADIQEWKPGVLVIASCAGLLQYTIATNRLDTLFTLKNTCVRNIWQYNGYLFFGTYGSGFYIYSNGKLKSMPLDKNKYLLYTHCFVPDDSGYCWISTNRGLFKASLKELINAFENNSSAVYYHYFGKKDGMEMTELNGGCTPCALRLKNRVISFPTMDGLLWVSPEKAIPILPYGDIYIDEIRVDNVPVNITELNKKSLPAKTSEIILQLAYSAWSNKENIYIDYQLNDTVNWKPVTLANGSEIHLNNLPPGDYVLRIRKLNGFGVNNYTYKTVQFSITTPWTQRWWFYLLCALALFGLITIYFRYRTRRYKLRQEKLEQQVAEKTKELQLQNEMLEKNNSIKTRLISIISHDIVTPLKFVTAAGKSLLEKRTKMPDGLQQETIQEITNTSQELHLLSTNILNWIKYQHENRRLTKENFSVHELVEQVLGILNSLANQKKLKLVNDTNKDLIIHQFYEPLKILVYNLVSNAINFSEQGTITISSSVVNKQVIISVKDNGVGMTPEQITNIMADEFIVSSANIDKRKGNGLGYLIIKDLVKMMGAGLKIESKKGSGTTVSVTLNS